MTDSLPAARLAEAYEVLEVVRRGGLSTTVRARHRGTGDLRCIDVLRPAPGEREALERRLDAEARPLMELRHPSLARLVDAAVGEGGQACLVREDHEGVTLRRLTGSQRPSVALAVELLRQTADALAFLHPRGRTVGDLSPEGMLLGRGQGHEPQLVLADLGLAKDWQEEASLTAAGLFVGRLRYAAPEQFDVSGRKGAPGDIYALGLVAYELLTGRHPIEGDSASSLIAGHLFRPPMGFSDADPEGRVPEALRQIVLSTLAKEPDQRPTAATLRDGLKALQAQLPAIEPSELDRWLGPRAEPQTILEGSRTVVLDDDKTSTSAPSTSAGSPDGSPDADEAQLEDWLEEAHALAREEEFLAARDKVRQVLKVQPDHSMGLMLLASLEACLKIQVEESKAHQTLVVSQDDDQDADARDSGSVEPQPQDVRETLAGGTQTVQMPIAGRQPDLGTETVRVTAKDLQEMAAEASDAEEAPSPEPPSEPPSEPPPVPTAAAGEGTTQLLKEELPGTVTMPMEQIEAQKRKALEAAESAGVPPQGVTGDAPGDRPMDAVAEGPAEEREGSGPIEGSASLRDQASPEVTLPVRSTPQPASAADEAEEESQFEASWGVVPEPTQPATPPLTPAESVAPTKPPSSVDELGFGGSPAPSYEPQEPRRGRRGRGRRGRSRRGTPESKSGGTWIMVGAAFAAVLVFTFGYAISSGVDLRQLFGQGDAVEVVPPSELPPVAAEPGRLLLDAAPWAEIVQITDPLGEDVPLRFRHTPARYELAPGAYTVIMAGPGGESETLEVEVVSSQDVERRPVFEELSVDDYFRRMGWR